VDPVEIAIKEHVSRQVEVHPAQVRVDAARDAASVDTHPLRRYPVQVRTSADDLVVASAGPPRLDLTAARRFWQHKIGVGRWLYDDLFHAFVDQFVADVVVEDPPGLAAQRGRGLLFLANHQVAIESPAFWTLIPALTGNVTVILAKDEHRHTWIGDLMANAFAHPGVQDPGSMIFFNRSDPAQLLKIVEELRGLLATGVSVLVHVEGTRAQSCRSAVSKLSSVWLDLALVTQTPIVPVRFRGGLPVTPAAQRLEFPLDFGKQTIHLGSPISTESLRALPFAERGRAIMQAINALGGSPETEVPHPGDPDLAAAVRKRAQGLGVSQEKATCIELLARVRDPSAETQALLAAVAAGVVPKI
jgi:1-acyl-sn-glycerol-3-phosphate acyltransferase